jgi:pimeloyl-ACP methyl ester carboxylesterase
VLEANSVDDFAAVDENPRWLDLGGDGPQLHFAHANGFPPETYRVLVGELQQTYHVESMLARPLWSCSDPVTLNDWSELAADLSGEINRRGLRGVATVGHSLGAVCSLIAAAKDPNLFSAIVAIDPLVLTGTKGRMWGVAKKLGQAGQIGLVKGALRRREIWPDRATARRAYSLKGGFRVWQDEIFDDYVSAGLVATPDGEFKLRYPRQWEARIFEIAPHDLWSQLRRVEIPVLFIQGEQSDTFVDAARKRVVREMPNAKVAVVAEATHFVPMEKPNEVARLAMEFLADVQGGVV